MPTLQFKGKNIIWNHHLSIPYHTLDEVSKLAHQADKADGNLIIEGDNLLALKALLPMYAGKVKCIYIDPPYNTGNEGWVYNDKVNSPLIRDWLGKVVGKDDLTRHDKWLCMMAPRLRLLRELLADDGIIFISIDDNEMHRLKMVCDEVFGEDRFIATINWRKVYSPRMDAMTISLDIDYLLVYSKSEAATLNKVIFEQNKRQFNCFDESTGRHYRRRQWRKEGSSSRKEDRPNLYYPIKVTGSTDVYPIRPDGSEGRWRGSLSYFEELSAKGLVECIQEGGKWEIYIKQYFDHEATQPPSTFWDSDFAGHNQDAALEIKTLFGKNLFSTPKPTTLIRRIFQCSTDTDSIVLDSFAGSGSTMHAVMDLNNEDDGNRKCILVQMTEATDSDPEKNICRDITRERVKRAIEKYGYDSGFKYLRVGIPIDAESMLSGELPTYEQFAKYVYYLCTGENLVQDDKIDEGKYFVGTFRRQAIYLIYKQNYDTLTRLALNLTLAENITKGQKGMKCIVYAPACFLEEEYLQEKSIEFVGIPYNLFKRNNA